MMLDLDGLIKHQSETRTDNYKLAVVAMFQNESRWLSEWIEYHHLLGVEHFYLYNNLSEDNYQIALKPYVSSGLVEIIDWHCEKKSVHDEVQCCAYNDVINRTSGKVAWLAVIDIDEFLVPIKDDNLIQFLDRFNFDSSIGGICAAWVFFGTSDINRIPQDKLMIETLIKNGGDLLSNGYFPWHEGLFKTIVRPDCVDFFDSPHYANYTSGYEHVEVFYDLLQINHYWTKDQDFFINTKIPRKMSWGISIDESNSRAESMNQSTLFGNPILRFVPELRKKLAFHNPLIPRGDGQND